MRLSKLIAIVLPFYLVACDSGGRKREAVKAEAAFARDIEAMQRNLLERSEGCERIQQQSTVFRRLRETVVECLEKADVAVYAFRMNVRLQRTGLELRSLDGAVPLLSHGLQQECIIRPVRALKMDTKDLVESLGANDLWPAYQVEIVKAGGKAARIMDNTSCVLPEEPLARPNVTALVEVRDSPFVAGSKAANDRITNNLRECEVLMDTGSRKSTSIFEIELHGFSGRSYRDYRCAGGVREGSLGLRRCYCEALRGHFLGEKTAPLTVEAVATDGKTVRSRGEAAPLPLKQRWWLIRTPERSESAPRFYALRSGLMQASR